MIRSLQGFELKRSVILMLVFVMILAVGCSGTTVTPTSTPASFSYLVQVQAQDTGEDISIADVTIQVAGRAPLDAITDSRGVARVFIDSTYVNRPGFLIVEARGYEPYRQNIDLVKGALPDVIRLEPETTIPLNVTPLATSTATTATPTDAAPNTPTTTPATPADTSTVEPASTLSPQPPPTSTLTPTPTPSETPTAVTEATSGTAPRITGRLAIPLIFGGQPKVHIVTVNGQLQGILDMARQPNYSRDGSSLIVNGDGGPLDKLRVSDPTASSWHEIGDTGLGGHSHPFWSPDGSQLIYDDNTIGGHDWRIFRRDLISTSGPGEELAAVSGPIVNNNPLYPLWTTGNRFIFRSCNTWSGGGDCGLWMMSGDKGETQRLTDNFNHIPMDVEGDILLYATNDGGGDWNVYSLNLTDSNVKRLTANRAADSLATISPDGRSVAFLSNRDGLLAIWYVGINGGSPQKMFDIRENEWGTLSSDGWSEERLSWAP